MTKPKLTPFLLITIVTQLAFAADNQLTKEEENQGWILLFDGKSLDGWITSDSKPSQRPVENGTLNPHKSGGYMLVTKKEFGDFKLQLDFKLSPRCNSGVFFRVFSLSPQPGKDVGYNGIEVAIDDTKTAGYVDAGAIYDLSKPTKNALRPLGQWNHLELTSRDNRAIVELNDKVVNEVDFNKFTEIDKRPDGTPHKFGVAFKDFPRRGRIGLQDHGADIWFKNIKLLPLGEGESGSGKAAARSASPPETNIEAANDPVNSIWDRPLMAQQFDEKQVRAIRVPEWLAGTTNYCYGATAYLDESESYGVQMTELAFGDPDYLRYPSKYFQMDPRASPDDLSKQVAEVRRRGMRVIAAFTPCFQREAYIAHSDWRLIPTNTTDIPNDIDKNSYGGWLCQIGPWGDQMIDLMEEIQDKYKVDGFGFDGMHHQRVCYCEHCRQRYKADTNEEIPNVDMKDPAYRRYLLWYDRQMERFVERAQERIKAKNPDCALVTWTTNAGRFGHFRDIPHNMPARMNALLDCPCQELWMDETNRGNSVVPAFGNAYLWATTNHRVASNDPYIMSHGNPYGQDSFPRHEVERRALLVLTHGPQVSIATGWGPRILPAVWRVLSSVEERQPWLTKKKPEPWATLVMSDNTRNFYGRDPGQVEERYLAHVFGAYRAALEEHLPLAVINDWNLNDNDLAAYKVLILANTAALNDGQAKAVREFVKRGGGLVATADSSLFGETGDERDNFALADVFGVDFASVPISTAQPEELDTNFNVGLGDDYWQKRKSVFELSLHEHTIANHPQLDEYMGRDPVTFKGPALSVKQRADAVGAHTIATMRPWRKPEPDYPAIVTNQYGKGRVVYISAGIDAAYYLYPYPYQRLLLAQSIRWAAAAPPPIEVEAPMCVHVTCFRQTTEGERLVVHLYNDVNTTGNHALPDEDVPLREEVLPIHDLRVTFRPDYRITRAHLQPGNGKLEINRTAAGTTVTVRQLDIHCMIVAELE